MSTQSPTTTVSSWYLYGQVEEHGAMRQIRIDAAPFQVGRRNGLPLYLPCLSVSKLHAEVLNEGDALWVRDLDSTNGTYINGERIRNETLLKEGDLVQFGNLIFQVGRDEVEAETGTIETDAYDRAMALVQFDKLMNKRAVVPFFQPIVELEKQRNAGFEVLGRSRLFGVNTPSAMFQAASQLNLEAELSRMLRAAAIQTGTSLPGQPMLYLNTHPIELIKPGLVESLAEVREAHPTLSLTLEIHEGAVTVPAQMIALRQSLRDLSISLAYDDFGAGQSRLLELAETPPDTLKFDMKLIRGIHAASAQRQQMLANLVRMTTELGVMPLAEGVECQEEHATCVELGFQLGQGYYYGRPAPAQIHEGLK